MSFANNCLGCVTNCLHCFSAGASLLLWLVVVSHFSSERPFSQKIFLNIQLSVSFLFLYSVFNEHLSYCFRCASTILVGSSGLEPPTSRLSGARSNQLSYEPIDYSVVFPTGTLSAMPTGGDDGIRTHDPLLAGQVLSQLSYTPILGIFFFTVPEN